MWDKLTASTAREFMTKVWGMGIPYSSVLILDGRSDMPLSHTQDAKTGKMRDTGVRFADIAGLDHIVTEMKEIVKMLLGDPVYKKVIAGWGIVRCCFLCWGRREM